MVPKAASRTLARLRLTRKKSDRLVGTSSISASRTDWSRGGAVSVILDRQDELVVYFRDVAPVGLGENVVDEMLCLLGVS